MRSEPGPTSPCLIEIRRGSPEPDEVAAVVVALLGRAGGTPDDTAAVRTGPWRIAGPGGSRPPASRGYRTVTATSVPGPWPAGHGAVGRTA